MSKAAKPKAKPGRPSIYSDAIAETICLRIAEGETLRAICLDEGMPSRRVIFHWLNDNKEFLHQYTQARARQAETWADELVEIAYTPEHGVTRKETEKGVEVTTGDMLGHRKLKVDTLKWLMAKAAPKKYGDKVALEHTGADGGPIETREISDTERARRIAFTLQVGARAVDKE